MGLWKHRKNRMRRASLLVAGGLLGWSLLSLTACTTRPAQTPDERLQHQAAENAKQVRHDLKDAGVEARHALRQAGRDTKDIVAGARQGWREGAPAPRSGATGASMVVDVNHASVAELERLPGVHAAAARRIVARRPFHHANELEKQGIVSHAEYERIASQLTAN